MLEIIIKVHQDECGGGSTIAVKGIVLIVFFAMLTFVVLDFYYVANVYRYVKDQQELSNRAVYAEIDLNALAEREIYIDEIDGFDKFEEYLFKNLALDSEYVPEQDIRIVGSVVISNFEIYNATELPAVMPTGKTMNEVCVYSEITVEIRPLFFGRFGTVTLTPEMTTYIPEYLLRNYHP